MNDYLAQRRAYIEAGRPLKEKKKYVIPKVSEKRKQKLKELSNTDNALDKWFEERKKELTGICNHCGGKTFIKQENAPHDESVYKNEKEFAIHCIAHILPKAYFPSVATHPLNWIELCFWGKNCHAQMDNKVLDLIDMHCFDEIVRKFVAIYPSIEKSERRRIPQVLMNYIEVET